MAQENSIYIDNQEVTLKEPKLTNTATELDMFTVENSSTNSLTKTAKSIHIESAPVPG